MIGKAVVGVGGLVFVFQVLVQLLDRLQLCYLQQK